MVGPGALLAVGRADGVLSVHDARDLRELAAINVAEATQLLVNCCIATTLLNQNMCYLFTENGDT